MANRKGHTQKNHLEKQQYVNYIKRQDYEPTKEEGLDFNHSSNNDEDYSISKTHKPRRLSILEQIKEHIEKNWVAWLIGGVSVTLIYFGFSSQFKLNSHELSIEQTKNGINSINQKIQTIESENNNQNLRIRETEIRLEYLKSNNLDTPRREK